jgi:hypothetical protein
MRPSFGASPSLASSTPGKIATWEATRRLPWAGGFLRHGEMKKAGPRLPSVDEYGFT